MRHSTYVLSDIDLFNISRQIILFDFSVRELAVKYGISKSGLCNKLHERVPSISASMYQLLKIALEKNFNEKHIKGGISTKKKFQHLKYK